MKKLNSIMIAVSAILITVGVGGTVYAAQNGNTQAYSYGYGMMGRGGRMYRNIDQNQRDYNDSENTSAITSEEAYNIANEYLSKMNDTSLSLGEAFTGCGYAYMFEVQKDGVETGVLHVNGTTGEAWYVELN